MPTSENDVLDLMNRAAMDAPSMSLAPQAVLASAQNRRRKQRQTRGGMALAAFAAAGAIWLGSGSALGDLLGTQVDPSGPTQPDDIEVAVPKEWDDSVAFEAPLPTVDGRWEAFAGASLVRESGGDFTVQLPGDAGSTLTSVGGDLPAGVARFNSGDTSVIVSESRFDGQPVMIFDEDQDGSNGVPLQDGDVQAFIWLTDQDVTRTDIRDVYWLLPDQVVSSTGATVINDVVSAGGDEMTVMIVPETGQWGKRSSSSVGDVLPIPGADDAAVDPVRDGDLWVSVLPGGTQNPVFNAPGSSDVQPMSTRAVDDYLIVWTTSSERDGGDSFASVTWDEPASTEPIETTTITATEEGDAIRVAVEGTESELTVPLGETDAQAAKAADGSALAIAALPEGISSVDGPPGPATAAPEAIFRMYSSLVAMREEEGSRPGIAVLPDETGMVAVGLPAAPGPFATDPFMNILPTLLFHGEAGPQWAGGGRPATVDVAGTEMRVSVESDLELWATSCGVSDATIGDFSSPTMGFAECLDPQGSGAMHMFAVSVQPTDVAASARLLPIPGGTIAPEDLADPIVEDLGDGLSLWVVPLGPAEPGLDLSFEGMDVDADGVVDRPPPIP